MARFRLGDDGGGDYPADDYGVEFPPSTLDPATQVDTRSLIAMMNGTPLMMAGAPGYGTGDPGNDSAAGWPPNVSYGLDDILKIGKGILTPTHPSAIVKTGAKKPAAHPAQNASKFPVLPALAIAGAAFFLLKGKR